MVLVYNVSWESGGPRELLRSTTRGRCMFLKLNILTSLILQGQGLRGGTVFSGCVVRTSKASKEATTLSLYPNLVVKSTCLLRWRSLHLHFPYYVHMHIWDPFSVIAPFRVDIPLIDQIHGRLLSIGIITWSTTHLEMEATVYCISSPTELEWLYIQASNWKYLTLLLWSR